MTRALGKRVLVTGAGGNLGRAAVPALLAAGHRPVLFDFRPLDTDQEFVEGDVRDAAGLAQAMGPQEADGPAVGRALDRGTRLAPPSASYRPQHDRTVTAGPRPGLRSLLAQPAYRRLWAARTISQVGDVAQFTTLALLVVTLTGSGLGVSTVVLAEIFPVLSLALLAGSLVDRLPRVRVMVLADVVRVALAAALALWHDHVAVAYAVAFGLSAGQVFFSPAAQSLLPSVVRDDELVAANSGIWTAAVTAQIIVAPLAALLAVEVGFGPAFALNAVSFALSALVLRGLREPARPRPITVPSPFAQACDGLKALEEIPLLKALALGQFLAALSAGATSALLVVLAQDRLGGGEGFGLLVAAIGAGAALGPLLLLRRIKDPRRPLFVFGPYAVRGVVDLVLAVVTTVPLAAGALLVYGLSTSTGNVTFSSLVQSRVPVDLRAELSPALTCSGSRGGS